MGYASAAQRKAVWASKNEKNLVGFISFIVMVCFAVADLMTSLIADKDLIINEVVYNSFVWVTLGCFGISSFEKIKK